MGRIKTLMMELAEMYWDLYKLTNNHGDALRMMRENLDEDDFEFFENNMDEILEYAGHSRNPEDTIDESDIVMESLKNFD